MTKRRGLFHRIEEKNQLWSDQGALKRGNPAREEHNRLVSHFKKQVVEILKRGGEFAEREHSELVREIENIADELIKNSKELIPQSQAAVIKEEIINDIAGYGPLQPLLKDPSISEIMVNNPHTVFIERNGKVEHTDIEFEDDDHVRHVIERIIAPLGRRIDESSPMVDARLPDGSRVNATIPPIALDGPNVTIRKFPEERLTTDDLLAFGSATKHMIEFIKSCVQGKRNIIISGGTGAGKTSLLNIFSNFIPLSERLITIEDSAELKLAHEKGGNIIRFEARPPNLEGKGEIPIEKLVRNSLRMRPNRIIVGECRGGEALAMLQAMNTGHEGSMTTIHANNPRDAITRLETMVLLSGAEMPYKVIKQNIANTVDLIIQQSRLQDGSRKIVSITEVVGIDEKTDGVILQEIFRFEQTGVTPDGRVEGKFVATGNVPTFLDKLYAMGIQLDPAIFKKEGD